MTTAKKKISNIRVSFMGINKGKLWIMFREKGKKSSTIIKFSKKDSVGIRKIFREVDESENRDRGSIDGTF